MRKLLNTLYVTREEGYLSLDGENVVLTEAGQELVRLPFTNLENIYCFNYPGCSPALMGKCAKESVGLCFISPSGRFLARVTGETKGNVFLRKQQIERFGSAEVQAALVQAILFAKLKNTRSLLLRSRRDHPETDADGALSHCIESLSANMDRVGQEEDMDILRGLEGESAKAYFSVFDRLFVQQRDAFRLFSRTKRPPLDRTNAMLSFLYTVCTNDIASALECVGLDPYIGVFHTLRPGRASLASDLMEEFRSSVERLVIGAVNLKIVQADDFETQVSGAVLLNEEGRKKVITLWQNKKREAVMHPFLKEKMQFGLFPYVQANLLAKFVRGELSGYQALKVE